MRRAVFFSSVMLIVLLWLTVPAGAQTKSIYARRYDADIEVLSNGDLRVTETLEIVFQGGPFHYGFRVIALKNLDDITHVEVWEGNQPYQPGGSSQAGTYRLDYEDGGLRVTWYFPFTSDAARTFHIRYTVRGAVRRYDDGDEVWWMAVHDDHNYTIRGSTVTLRLPEGVTINTRDGGDGYVADTDGVEAQLSVAPDRRSVTAIASEALQAGEFLAVGVKFTPGVVGGSKPSWQDDYDRKVAWEQNGKDVANLGFILVGLLTLIGLPLLVYLLWYVRGRDPHIGLVADYLTEPPEDVPPGVAGTLVDERADLQDVIATLIDLARRGYLTMDEEVEKGFAGLTTHRDFVFTRTDREWGDLHNYEKTLLKKLFGRRQSRRMSDLKNKFYEALPKIRSGLYDAVVEAGYFRASPAKTRQRYTLLGVALMGLAALTGIASTAVLSEWVDWAWCPSVGVGIGALLLAVVGQAMPVKTKKGAEAKARWEAFRRYLKEIERYTNLETATELFERYLPYAIAFNLERRWVNKFAQVETTPIPGWYRPYWMTGHTGYGRASGSRGSREGGGTPSVQSMSDGMARGFQSMSDGLVSMFNSVGKTFTSAPSSSGSGGFSGGGFSGGGSSGGGSSGFG